jgi:hypothetical protein
LFPGDNYQPMKPYQFIVIVMLASLISACNLPIGYTIVQTTSTDLPPASTPTVTNLPVPLASQTPIIVPTSTATPEPSAVPTIAPTPTQSNPMVTPLKDPVNCRFGPSINYENVFALNVGASAPITGRNSDSSWWQIKTTDGINQKCWVAASVVVSSGDLGGIAAVPAPASLLNDVELQIKPDSANVGTGCSGPFPNFILTGTISTNGPMKVTWQMETQQDGKLPAHTFTITKYGSQDITLNYVPSVWKDGTFWVHLTVTSPYTVLKVATYKVNCK